MVRSQGLLERILAIQHLREQGAFQNNSSGRLNLVMGEKKRTNLLHVLLRLGDVIIREYALVTL